MALNSIRVYIARDCPKGARAGRLRVHFGGYAPSWYEDHWNTNSPFVCNIPRELFSEIEMGQCVELSPRSIIIKKED